MIKYLPLILLFSCAKTSYLIEQGVGQLSLEWRGEDNSEVLSDPKVEQEAKRKIKIVQKAKKYFYEYFNIEPTAIYDETTFLKSRAVTYLVIASPVDEIKAVRTSFPIVGSFPYLGFFNRESAKAYKKEMEQKGYETYMREVYAYSTLNRLPFYDNILSSFFQLKDRDLVGLIFHELVHTVIFVKDDVSFNENLAEVISQELLVEYFQESPEQQTSFKERKSKNRRLIKLIADSKLELNELYQGTKDPKAKRAVYLKTIFFPKVMKLCEELEFKRCWPVEGAAKGQWNNARFAAMGTYSDKQNKILEFYAQSNKSLREFFEWIIQKYDKFDGDGKFLTYLEK